jgi:drug/metabolite transporter (DMT)-like permease
MISSLGFVAVYVLLVGVASFIERPAGRGLGAFQLNVLIRGGSLAAALAALVATHGLTLPSGAWLLAGLGIGLITGVGSIFYCLALGYMPVSLVVTFSNLYIVITILLGVVVLHEHVTALKVGGLACTLAGILILTHAPTRYGVNPDRASHNKALDLRALTAMGAYVVLIGVGAFLEKPALKGLDALQLNGVMAVAMTVVAVIAFVITGPRLPMTKLTLGGFGVGAMIGFASVFYFLGLQNLPVSIAAASSNAYVVVTVVLSTIFMRQPLTRARGGAVVLTLVGVTLLALSA